MRRRRRRRKRRGRNASKICLLYYIYSVFFIKVQDKMISYRVHY